MKFFSFLFKKKKTDVISSKEPEAEVKSPASDSVAEKSTVSVYPGALKNFFKNKK